MNALRSLGILIGPPTMTEGQNLNEARIMAWWDETHGPVCTHYPHPHQTVGLRVIIVQHQPPHQCHPESGRSGGSRHSHHGQCHREVGDHMKINLPVFKDEDTKDAISYQSWCWDLTLYHWAGCWDCTLLPYAICSLQAYPGELVRSLGTDITRGNVLAILGKHYNNVKALDTLNQELFKLHMGKKETVSEWRVHLLRHLHILAVLFTEHFLPDHVTELKHDCFYSGLSKKLKAMVAYLKASTNEKTYSDYLHAAWEAEKEEVMEPSHSQTAATTSKPLAMSFFPLQKLKGSQPTKTLAVWVAHLKEEDADNEECTDSKDPDGMEGVTEEPIVCLARAVNNTQQEEKHCYHCSSLDHFIRACPLVVASRTGLHLNWKEATALMKGAWTPLGKMTTPKVP